MKISALDARLKPVPEIALSGGQWVCKRCGWSAALPVKHHPSCLFSGQQGPVVVHQLNQVGHGNQYK